jgi:ABC-2 type transport system permease protein
MSSGLIGGGETIAMVERVTPPGMRVAEFPNAFQQNVPGYTIYGIFWIATLLGSSLSALIAVSLAAATTATGLGMLVSALARTEAQIGGLTTLLLPTMSALGGCFVPRFTMPDWLKTLGLITPHAWALDVYQDLFVRGYGLVEILPKVGMLGAFAIVFFAIGV